MREIEMFKNFAHNYLNPYVINEFMHMVAPFYILVMVFGNMALVVVSLYFYSMIWPVAFAFLGVINTWLFVKLLFIKIIEL